MATHEPVLASMTLIPDHRARPAGCVRVPGAPMEPWSTVRSSWRRLVLSTPGMATTFPELRSVTQRSRYHRPFAQLPRERARDRLQARHGYRRGSRPWRCSSTWRCCSTCTWVRKTWSRWKQPAGCARKTTALPGPPRSCGVQKGGILSSFDGSIFELRTATASSPRRAAPSSVELR